MFSNKIIQEQEIKTENIFSNAAAAAGWSFEQPIECDKMEIDTPLVADEEFIIAANTGNLGCVQKYLSQENKCIDIRDAYGRTPLILAALKGHAEIVEILLLNGASTTARDQFGMTALSSAAQCNHPSIVKMIENFENNYIVSNQWYFYKSKNGHLLFSKSPPTATDRNDPEINFSWCDSRAPK